VDLVLEEVERLKAEYGDKIFEIGQFERQENLQAHIENTAPEIWEQTGGHLDAFIMCQGTGGTVTGTAKYLKEKNPAIKYIISEPQNPQFWLMGKSGA
jgi:cysteine synthase A